MAEELSQSLKDRIKSYIDENKVVQERRVTAEDLDKKGYNDGNMKGIDDYIQHVGDDIANSTEAPFTQANLTSNYFPIRYDPKIYDQRTLFGITPYLTYMEARGRRAPTGFLTVNYMKWDTGFAGEWIAETADTAGGGAPDTSTATATVKYLAMPVNLSDIIGQGESRPRASQVLGFAQQALREEFNQTLVSGDSGGTEEFDGIMHIATDSGTKVDYNAAAITIENMDDMDATLSNTLKTPSTAVLTNGFVLNHIKNDMYSKYRTPERVAVGTGINPVSYMNNRGSDIPIIVDQNVTLTANEREILFFNENQVMIEDFLTPVLIRDGAKAGPFMSSFWLAQIAVQYHVAPASMVLGYDIK